jgi:hypothetical protein
MKWVVSGLGNGMCSLTSGLDGECVAEWFGSDASARPRLIVSYAKGMTKIYTLVNVLGEWMVETKPPTFTNESLAGPIASYVLDAMTGSELLPTAESLTAAIQSQHTPEAKKDQPPHCIWIAASKKSIRAAVNFNGERIAKVELEQDELSECFYVTRFGEPSDGAAGIGRAGGADPRQARRLSSASLRRGRRWCIPCHSSSPSSVRTSSSGPRGKQCHSSHV